MNYVEHVYNSSRPDGLLSFEERALLHQLNGQTKQEILVEIQGFRNALDPRDPDHQFQIELIDSFVEKFVNGDVNIAVERNLHSPLY